MTIDAVVARMEQLLATLQEPGDARRHFHATYLRTTKAVAQVLTQGAFLDPAWVEVWDVAFADLYLDALEAVNRGETPSDPWRIAFSAAAEQPGLPPLRHVLLGMNAHINYDLPQALLAVITDEEFDDPALVARRAADHHRIDDLLLARVSAEDDELKKIGAKRSTSDRLLEPANRAATKRFLRESRAKVWANAVLLSRARREGPNAYARRLRELEALSAARVADLVAPGQVILRLARDGFGVRLAERPGRVGRMPSRARSFDPVRVGTLECRVWVAYYRHEWATFLRTSVTMVHAAFGMSWPRTVYGAWLVLRANQLWAPFPNNDPDGARRCMRRFYAMVNKSHGGLADPRESARLEVEWWRVHRAVQHEGSGESEQTLVDALTRLYAFVYGSEIEPVRAAARHRVAAMGLSDQWVAEGCRIDSPLLAPERAALVRAYAALLAAVHH